VPGLNTRKATTTLQLKSGQTFAMAGLMQENYYQTVHKIPFLGDMPFIGSLFTAKEHSISESELVVMVTPTIVRAMNPAQVPGLPGNEIKTRTTDTDFFIQNDLDTTNQEQTARTEFRGKTGFIK
jgi:pilus assembly protein CpaC